MSHSESSFGTSSSSASGSGTPGPDDGAHPRFPLRVDGPRTLEIDEPVEALEIRVCGGAVNVVGSAEEGPARVEIGEVRGHPLTVSHEDGTLCVGYDSPPWKGPWKSLFTFLRGRGWRDHRAEVSVTVPAATRVDVASVGSSVVVTGVAGPTRVQTVSGDSTLVGLTGEVRTDTVSGRVEAQGVTGGLRFHSVSGDLTVLDGGAATVQADSVSGDMVLDLDPSDRGADIQLTSVSGEVAIRLPEPGDTRVEAGTTSGTLSNAFDTLRVGGGWGAKHLSGTLGSGSGRLKVTTVSGGLALLRRPVFETADGGHPGDGPATPSLEKKVL
ncbi:DUF4097 family beta strand repeat-containing protein [Streptomyces catenulae]|uniref:DUF4097 family beta strand repeat-containing protein n=1 Tax=Streptomyces catenulae TaxID=66875 RepID=A0ABV2YVE0_9ACTN|nr:DUF4097 family beta strand repeat-containing protein [Streptomyces catenulae]